MLIPILCMLRPRASRVVQVVENPHTAELSHILMQAWVQVHGSPVKNASAAPRSRAAERCAGQGLPMAPLDPALTVAQQRMNTQAGAKRRRGPAAKQPGSAPKQRFDCILRAAAICSCYACNTQRRYGHCLRKEAYTATWSGP